MIDGWRSSVGVVVEDLVAAAANGLGIRHVAFAVTDPDVALAALRGRGAELVVEVATYEDRYRLRRPEGAIVELAERLSRPRSRLHERSERRRASSRRSP